MSFHAESIHVMRIVIACFRQIWPLIARFEDREFWNFMGIQQARRLSGWESYLQLLLHTAYWVGLPSLCAIDKPRQRAAISKNMSFSSSVV